MHYVTAVRQFICGIQPVCFVRTQRVACPLPAICFLWRHANICLRIAKTWKGTAWHNKPSFAVPMAWIVKAHVFQAIRGTRGHSSLGAVCSPTLWTVVAHTTSISTMLSENFLLKPTSSREFRLLRYRKHTYVRNTDGADSVTHGSCTP